MVNHFVKHSAIAIAHPKVESIRPLENFVWFIAGFAWVRKKTAAEHRCQSERNNAGYNCHSRQGNGKFFEDLSDQSS